MVPVGSELAGINKALQHQEKIVREYEDHLFLEQLRLASLKAAGARALRIAMLSEEKSKGRVVDAITGDPIEGAKVILPSGEYSITGTDGRVTVWHKSREKGKGKLNATP